MDLQENSSMDHLQAVKDVKQPCQPWEGVVGHCVNRTRKFCDEYWRKWTAYRSAMEKYEYAMLHAETTKTAFVNPLSIEEARLAEEMNQLFSHLKHMSIAMRRSSPSSYELTTARIPSSEKTAYNDKNLVINAFYGRRGSDKASECDSTTHNKLVYLDGNDAIPFCVEPYFSDASEHELLCIESVTIESTMHYS